MAETATVAHLIDLSIQAERRAETLYVSLSKMFANCPDVAKFWELYAKEEAGHARWLENLRKRVGQEVLNQPADPEMLREANRNLAGDIGLILAGIQDLQEAYDTVNEIEHNETNHVFEFLVAHFAEDQNTQTFLRSQLRDHIGRLLMEFPENYRQPSVRRGIKPIRA